MADPLERARSLLEVGRSREAVDVLHQALAEEPDDETAHALLAQAHIGLDEPGPALAAAERAAALAPYDEWPHRLRSVALTDLRRYDEAVVAANDAVRAEPLAWQTHVQYALSAIRYPQHGQDCLRAAHRALELAPGEADAHFALGVVAGRLGRHQESDAAYRQALAIDPTHAPARNNLTANSGGSLRARMHGYTAALQEVPGLTVAQDNLADLAYRVARRFYWAAVVALVVCLVAALSRDSTALRAGVGVAMLVGLAAWSAVLVRSVPPGVRAFVRSRLTSDRFLLATVVLSAVMLLAACVAAFAPVDPTTFAALVVRPLGLANVALVVWGVVRARSD